MRVAQVSGIIDSLAGLLAAVVYSGPDWPARLAHVVGGLEAALAAPSAGVPPALHVTAIAFALARPRVALDAATAPETLPGAAAAAAQSTSLMGLVRAP